MSRSAHAQSTYKLQEMPHCRKCKGELIYVAAVYEGESNFRNEWECSRCGKIFPASRIKTPELPDQDKRLSEIINGNKRRAGSTRSN